MVASTKTSKSPWRELHQPILYNQKLQTTAGPKALILRPKPGNPHISADDHLKFWSAIGLLLYIVKHSRPDMSNAAWELSKLADGALPGHWKTVTWLIKYVLDTEKYD
jgi:hypothetical protein